MRIVLAAAAASLLFLGGAIAEQKTEVKPGNAPTESVGDAVPTMKEGCPETHVQAEAQKQEHPPTEAVGEAVPEMKTADAGDTKDCPKPAGG